MMTRVDILALLKRTTSTAWLEGMMSKPDSLAVIEAILAIGVEASRCIDDGIAADTISLAPGGTAGVCSITLVRASGLANSAIIPADYVLVSDRGVQFRTTAAVSIAIGVASFTLPLVTIRQTEFVDTWNDTFVIGTAGDVICVAGSAIVLDTGGGILFGPPGTVTITSVTASTSTTGGMSDWLSVLGDERGQQRQGGEDTSTYRMRVRNIPDAVSPKALATAAAIKSEALGVGFLNIEEPFEDGADIAIKGPLGLGTFSGVYADTGVDFCSDIGRRIVPSPLVTSELVSLREARAYFRANLSPPTDAVGEEMFIESCYCDDPLLGFPDVGISSKVLSSYLAVSEELGRKRAAGVQFDTFVQGNRVVAGTATINNGAYILTFEIFPSPSYYWMFLDGHHGLDTTPSGLLYDSLVLGCYLNFEFSDGTFWSSGPSHKCEGERLTRESLMTNGMPADKLMIGIHGYARSDGVNFISHVGQFTVLEVAL